MNGIKRICVGKITGAHGVTGTVRVRSLTEDPEDLFAYAPLTDETGAQTFVLSRKGVMKDHFIVGVQGVTDRDAALALRNVRLFVTRDQLPETKDTEFYVSDLVGLVVHDASNDAAIGTVIAVHDYGAGIFLEIKPEGGASFMLPFKDAFVPKVDVAGGALTANLPEDWLKPTAKDEP